MDNSFIKGLFENPKTFLNTIKDTATLAKIMSEHPAQAKYLIAHAIHTAEICDCLLATPYDLLLLLESCPTYADILLEEMVSAPTAFKRLILASLKIAQSEHGYPNYIPTLIQAILNNTEVLNHLKRQLLFFEMKALYPAFFNVMMPYALKDDSLFKRLISDSFELEKVLTFLPAYKDRVIQYLLNHEDLFRELVCSNKTLLACFEASPKNVESIVHWLFTRIKPENNIFAAFFINSATQLNNTINTLPQYVAKFADQLFADKEAFQRYVYDLDDLGMLARVMPTYTTKLIHFVLSEPDEFQRLIADHYTLLKVPYYFPFYSGKFIEKVLADEKAYLHLIPNDWIWLSLVESFKSRRELLLEHVMKNDKEFQRLIPDNWVFGDLIKRFPDVGQVLLNHMLCDDKLFKRYITSYTALKQLLKAIGGSTSEPIKAAFAEKISADKALLYRLTKECFYIGDLLELLPSLADPLIECILNDNRWFDEVVLSPRELWFDAVVTTTRELRHLAAHAPAFRNQLMEYVLKDEEKFKRIFHTDKWNLIACLEAFPDHATVIIERLLKQNHSKGDEFWGFIFLSTKDLATFIRFCPTQYISVIAEKFLRENDATFDKFVINVYDLQLLAEAMPSHADALVKRVLKDEKAFSRLIRCQHNLAVIAKTFPQHKVAFAEKVFTNANDTLLQFFSCADDWLAAARMFPSHRDYILAQFLKNDEVFDNLVGTKRNFLSLIVAFPEFTEALLKPLFKDARRFTRYITSEAELKMVAARCDNYALPSFKEAVELIENTTEIKTAVVNLARLNFFSKNADNEQGRYKPVLNKLSTALISKIASNFANPEVYTEKEAMQLATTRYKEVTDILQESRTMKL